MKQHALLADDLVRAGILKQGKTVLYSAFEERIISVSYTHLRAHETVLDIVCRLLLEKKTH